MAVRTLTESKSLESNRHSLLLRCVAALASYTSVQAGECEACLRMIEVCHRLPCSLRVAALALRTKLPLMLILVARRTVGLQGEKAFRCVTLGTGERSVFTFENITGLPVIELGDPTWPPN